MPLIRKVRYEKSPDLNPGDAEPPKKAPENGCSLPGSAAYCTVRPSRRVDENSRSSVHGNAGADPQKCPRRDPSANDEDGYDRADPAA